MRLAELLRSCGLALVEQRTLGSEIGGNRAWGGFATAIVKSDTAWFGGWWTVGEEASDACDRIEGREPPERIGLTKAQALQQGRIV